MVIKALDPYWIRIRIGLQHETLDPDPEKMNTDTQPWFIPDPGSEVFPPGSKLKKAPDPGSRSRNDNQELKYL